MSVLNDYAKLDVTADDEGQLWNSRSQCSIVSILLQE